jgi:hypothetical protein
MANQTRYENEYYSYNSAILIVAFSTWKPTYEEGDHNIWLTERKNF